MNLPSLPVDSDARDDSSADLEPAEAQIRAWRKTLRPGGPEVDPVAILAYFDKTLSAEDAQYVQQLIHTFEAWSSMYWEIYAASLDTQPQSPLGEVSSACPLVPVRAHVAALLPEIEPLPECGS